MLVAGQLDGLLAPNDYGRVGWKYPASGSFLVKVRGFESRSQLCTNEHRAITERVGEEKLEWILGPVTCHYIYFARPLFGLFLDLLKNHQSALDHHSR